MPNHANKKHIHTVLDWDDFLVETTVHTKRIYADHMFRQVLQIDPGMSQDEFMRLGESLRLKYKSTTQGWQNHFSQPSQWCFSVFRAATADMIDTVIAKTRRQPELIALLEELDDSGHQLSIMSHSMRGFIMAVAEHLGIHHLFPREHVIDIEELENRMKDTPAPYEYLDTKFGPFKIRNLGDNTLENVSCARRMGYRGWYKGPRPSQPEGFDFQRETTLEILRDMRTASCLAA